MSNDHAIASSSRVSFAIFEDNAEPSQSVAGKHRPEQQLDSLQTVAEIRSRLRTSFHRAARLGENQSPSFGSHQRELTLPSPEVTPSERAHLRFLGNPDNQSPDNFIPADTKIIKKIKRFQGEKS